MDEKCGLQERMTKEPTVDKGPSIPCSIQWAGRVAFAREMGIEKFWTDSNIVGDPVVRSAVLLTAPVRQRAPLKIQLQGTTKIIQTEYK